jgi:hypothetical protein
MARSFDGVDDFIALPAGLVLALNSAVTVAFWSHTAGGAADRLFDIGAGDAADRCSAHAPWSDNVLYWDYGSVETGRISTNYASYINKWTHVGLVSSGNANTFQGIYLDGVLANSAATSDGPNVATAGGRIGSHRLATEFHAGIVAEFAVWNVVLSAGEISALAKGTLPNAIRPANSLGYWPLWGVASPEPDLSPSWFAGRNNGTVTGAVQANHSPTGLYVPKPRLAVVRAPAVVGAGQFVSWIQDEVA